MTGLSRPLSVTHCELLRRWDERAVAVAQRLVATLAQCGVARRWWQRPTARRDTALLLYPVGSGTTTRTELVERLHNAISPSQLFRQHNGIFQRHAAALTHMRRGSMCGVADEEDVAA